MQCFGWNELRDALAVALNKNHLHDSTLGNWIRAVLDVPPHEPGNGRTYDWEEFQALICWARAGEIARRGERSSRAQRRVKIYWELMENGSKTTGRNEGGDYRKTAQT